MNKVYINAASIWVATPDQQDAADNWLKVDLPKITHKLLSPNATRRMSKAVKMGIFCSLEAVNHLDPATLDGILVGSSKGCLIDSDKFLQSIVEQQEEFLSPTPFIQSTHNTVAGQIALLIKNQGYNMTYSQGRISFESAVLDAYIQLTMNERNTLLVGAVEELSDISIKVSSSFDKTASPQQTTGISQSEGAGFFIFSNQQDQHTRAELTDISIYSATAKLSSEAQLLAFLKKNKVSIEQIDAIIYGSKNTENAFDAISTSFNNTRIINYQLQIGCFDTDIVFALDLALKLLYNQTLVQKSSPIENGSSIYQNILICNFGEQNSLMLLSGC